MNTIRTMGEEIAWGLRETLPQVGQSVVQKLALAVGRCVPRIRSS